VSILKKNNCERLKILDIREALKINSIDLRTNDNFEAKTKSIKSIFIIYLLYLFGTAQKRVNISELIIYKSQYIWLRDSAQYMYERLIPFLYSFLL